MKKRTLLSVLLLASTVFAGAISCGNNDDEPTPDPDPEQPVEEYDHVFTGKVTLDKVYDVTLKTIKGKNEFILEVAEGIKTVKGTYTFADGVGYEFIFNDANKTVVNSTYNETKKAHEITYTIKAGDKGEGDVVLSLADENFTPTVEGGKLGFIKNAIFTGALAFGENSYPFSISFKADKTFLLDFETEAINLDKEGTYTFENNTFAITFDGATHKSTYNPSTSTYTFDFKFKGPQAELPLKATYTHKQKAFSAFTNSLGGVTCDVSFFSNKKALFDITCDAAFPGANEMFDRTYSWKKNAGTYQILNDNGEVLTTATLNEETKEYEMKYTLQGDKAITFDLKSRNIIIDGALTGVVEKPFACDFTIEFFDEGKASVDVDTKLANGSMAETFDRNNCTWTIENNVISLTDGEKVFKSTWDETTGTYKMNYEMQGKDGTFGTECTYSLW